MVNRRMEETDDELRFRTTFQIILFIRAQFEVPKWYLLRLIKLLK
jgi:hypothetical protein